MALPPQDKDKTATVATPIAFERLADVIEYQSALSRHLQALRQMKYIQG